jgi:hypothetical protein
MAADALRRAPLSLVAVQRYSPPNCSILTDQPSPSSADRLALVSPAMLPASHSQARCAAVRVSNSGPRAPMAGIAGTHLPLWFCSRQLLAF